jgi:hypothetical protein
MRAHEFDPTTDEVMKNLQLDVDILKRELAKVCDAIQRRRHQLRNNKRHEKQGQAAKMSDGLNAQPLHLAVKQAVDQSRLMRADA